MRRIPINVFALWVVFTIVKSTIIQFNNSVSQNGVSGNSSVLTCSNITYTSSFTMCEISFNFCNLTSFTFISCQQKQCQRYIRGSQCRLWTRLVLNQTQCYKSCCGSTQFNEKNCNDYNIQKDQSQSIINGVIIAIIVISSLILIAVIGYLLIKVQKCCKKSSFQKISKYNIVWKNQNVPDLICQICNISGANIQTPCDHYFHLFCFQQKAKQNELPLCPKCTQEIKQSLKISCSKCKEKAFKIKLWRIQHLEEIMIEAKAMHDQVCSQFSKSDQKLLPSYQN